MCKAHAASMADHDLLVIVNRHEELSEGGLSGRSAAVFLRSSKVGFTHG